MMRCLVYHRTGPAQDVLTIEDRPMLEPGAGEVRVRLHASGVNPHDTKGRSGWTGGTVPPGGLIPHSDGAGVIDAIGDDVDPARIGTRVYTLGAPHGGGTAAEAIVLPVGQVIDLPHSFSFAEGASLGVPAFTAWLALLRDGPVQDEVVLIQGGGGVVGRVAVELAVLSGATVIATGRSHHSRAIAAGKGAHHVLPVDAQTITDTVMDLTMGQGVGRIVEVDFAANQSTDAAVIAVHGTIASYSCSSNRMPPLDYYSFARKAVRLSFVQGLALSTTECAAAAATLATLFASGHLRPDISSSHPLIDAAAAHKAVESGAPANVVVTLD